MAALWRRAHGQPVYCTISADFEDPVEGGEDECRAHTQEHCAVERLEAAQQPPIRIEHDIPVAERGEGDGREVERRLQRVELAECQTEQRPGPHLHRVQRQQAEHDADHEAYGRSGRIPVLQATAQRRDDGNDPGDTNGGG